MKELANRLYEVIAIDDSSYAIQNVVYALVPAGFEVITAESGEEAITQIKTRGIPDLALVDLDMPGMNGFKFCEIVQEFCDLPTIFVTASSSEKDIDEGLKKYGEDYIVKPYIPNELVHRINRVLRRVDPERMNPNELLTQIDDRLTINLANQEVIIDERIVPLSASETKLLHVFLRNVDRTVSSQFLISRFLPLCPDMDEGDINALIYRLRQKIEPDNRYPQYIITESENGFMLTKKQNVPLRLRDNLRRYFNLSELADLCFDLRINFDALPGIGLDDKTRELIAYCERHGRLAELQKRCSQLRNHISW